MAATDRSLVFAGALVAALCVPSTARADSEEEAEGAQASNTGFGRRSDLVISVDRLVPLVAYASGSVEVAGRTAEKTHATSVGSNDMVGDIPTDRIPRFAIDYALVDHLTIGGSILFSRLAYKGFSDTSGTFWGIAPRVGWVSLLGSRAALWPRAGVEYVQLHGEGPGSTSVSHLFDATLECALALFPVEHVAFTVSPVLTLPIAGSSEVVRDGTTSTTDLSSVRAVLAVGLLGHL